MKRMFSLLSLLVLLVAMCFGCASMQQLLTSNTVDMNPLAKHVAESGMSYQGPVDPTVLVDETKYVPLKDANGDYRVLMHPSGLIFAIVEAVDPELPIKHVYLVIVPGNGLLAYAYKVDGAWVSYNTYEDPNCAEGVGFSYTAIDEVGANFLDGLERQFLGASCKK